MESVTIAIELRDDEALAFAEFLKRVQREDYERRAGDVDEAFLMYDAGVVIQAALRRAGFAPR